MGGFCACKIFHRFLVNTLSSYHTEPHNMHGERAVMIWLRSLQKEIPVSSSLAVSFLACHVAREAILSTDIWKWTLDGKLPYLNAFVKIKDDFSCPSNACPLSLNVMFRPLRVLRPMALESRARFVAQCIGLELPPVNFYAIVCRYLKQLSLSKEKILPLACRVYEWSMPLDLWLSANPHKISSHVCVMSILIVTIRVLYNIDGFGKWEIKALHTEFNPDKLKISTSKVRKRNDAATKYSDPDPDPDPDLKIKQPVETQTKGTNTTAGLLLKLETTYENIMEEHGWSTWVKPVLGSILKFSAGQVRFSCGIIGGKSKFSLTYIFFIFSLLLAEYLHDLPTYLQFCKDVVFAEPTRSLQPNEADQKPPDDTLIEELWNYYENQDASFNSIIK
ncbi:hypothetical protein GIB67_032347 [Kingdonia uniflora]|uniref:Rrn7/TAF1B C-terminal cyclin domain-containing protein n=1 Tax=Kingdonia uniflora TaxID=39325 RepID=A0A7J7MXH2_9MAGN|nr:hypothetical protein GIB67_032347 [Kingdonia uniflora]